MLVYDKNTLPKGGKWEIFVPEGTKDAMGTPLKRFLSLIYNFDGGEYCENLFFFIIFFFSF